MLWSEEFGPKVEDLALFPDFVDGMWWIWIQDSTGTSPGRRATATCASLFAAGLFIDLQSLFGDGAFLDLSWRFDVSSNRRLGVGEGWRRPLVSTSAANPRDSSVFFYLLGVYLQSFQDDYFCLVFSLVFTLCSCNLIFY
jgi:hypothetical protein